MMRKTILVPVDFSPASDNAARYGLHLARRMQAHLKLCHVINVPREPPIASWPREDFDLLAAEANGKLKLLADVLTNEGPGLTEPPLFKPSVSYVTKVGEVIAVISELVEEARPALVVMGMSGISGLKRAVFGSCSRGIMDKEAFPVLFIPAKVAYHVIRTIAFATELGGGDIDVLYALVGLASTLDAELLLLNLICEKYEEPVHERIYEAFAKTIASKIDYPKLTIKHLRDIDIAHGLEWLVEHGHVEIVAMVHHQPGFFDRIFETSDTQKFARHTKLPLLVFSHVFNIVG